MKVHSILGLLLGAGIVGIGIGCGSSGSTPVIVADAGGGCSFGEPNDTRETATIIDVNHAYSALCVSNPDGTDEKDFYSFTAPTDIAGGYVEVQMTNVATSGLADVIVTSAVDNNVLFEQYQTTNGASAYGWLTVSPGATYRVQVNRFAGAGDRFTYDLLLKYTPISDTFEPNNTKETAKTIQVNTPITASAAAHSPNTELAAADAQDWYKVTLSGGDHTITLSNSPADYSCDVILYDSTGASVGENYTTTAGANCQIDATGLAAGDYYVMEQQFAGTPLRAKDGQTVPSFITGHYTLEVK